jgi:hypothetical protein
MLEYHRTVILNQDKYVISRDILYYQDANQTYLKLFIINVNGNKNRFFV